MLYMVSYVCLCVQLGNVSVYFITKYDQMAELVYLFSDTLFILQLLTDMSKINEYF